MSRLRIAFALVVALIMAATTNADAQCARFGRCAGRPRIRITTEFAPVHDGDGASRGRVVAGVWALSATTPEFGTIYRRPGNIYNVRLTDLIANSAPRCNVAACGGDRGLSLRDAIRRRRAPVSATRPRPHGAGVLVVAPVNIPDRSSPPGYAPPDGNDGIGSNTSLSCRGPGCVLWGVETPTGRNGHFLTGGGFRSSGSGTGYAGFLIRGGTEFIDTGTRAHTRWVNMTTGVRNSTAKWALGWVPVGRYWARVWVLMRLTPDDHAVAPFVIVRRP